MFELFASMKQKYKNKSMQATYRVDNSYDNATAYFTCLEKDLWNVEKQKG